jgi:tetratricopeptide (TPR) repeat protein
MISRPRRAGRAKAQDPASRSGHARRDRWWPAVPALVALVLYAPSLSLGFVRDDHGLIEGHAALREGPAELARALASDFHAGTGGGSGKWRPWVTLSYAVDGALGGWRPAWFHATNVIAHALASACVALLVAQSGVAVPIALLAGTAFAAMPAHVEPVSWIAARTDLLAGLFMCAALWVDGRRRRARRGGPGWIAPGLFALALLSKETAVAFLAVIAVAVGSAAGAARPARTWRWLAPYALVAALWAAAWFMIGGVPARPDHVDAARAQALERGAAWTAAALLRFTLPGVTHAPDWPLPSAPGGADPRVAAGLALWAALALAVAVAARKRSAFATPLALSVAPLVPVALGAFGGLAGGAVMAERVVYAASAGVVWTAALAAAWALARCGPRRRAAALLAGALAGVVLAYEASVTWRDQSMYRDDAHVYAAMWARVPQHATGAVGLATVRMAEGRLDEALALLEQAEALDPRIPEIHQARAEIAFARARWAEAAAAADRVVGLEPTRAYPRLLRAAARVRMGEGDAVAAELDSLGELLPYDPLLLAARGERRLAAGLHAEAAADLERALRAQPGDPFTGLALARALRATGANERALAVLDHVVRIAPASVEAWQAYADAAGAIGRAAQRDSALALARLLRDAAAARP